MARTWDTKPSVFMAAVRKGQNDALRTAAFKLLRQVVQISPVDTGRFRGNWQVGLGSDPGAQPLDYVRSEGDTMREEGAKLRKGAVKQVNQVYLVNNVEYARYVDEGSSEQAPQGVSAVAMLQVARDLEER